MRAKGPGRVAIGIWQLTGGRTFFQIFTLFLADLLLRKKGDCRRRRAKKGGFISENYFDLRRRAAPLDPDRHDDDNDGHQPKKGPPLWPTFASL